MLLKNQIAIVTGGGRGIGRGIASRFAMEGAQVVLAQRDQESGLQTQEKIEADGGKAVFIPTDVSDRPSVENLVSATCDLFGEINILVNNAGITGINGPFLEVTQETWNAVIGVNLTGVFNCSQAAGRVMRQSGRGNIIHISSVNGFLPQPLCAAYGAAKGGIETLTKSMATDLAPHFIRVNAIAPGEIKTSILSPNTERKLVPDIPMRRLGTPEEVAKTIYFLCSEQSSYVNGAEIHINGGQHA